MSALPHVLFAWELGANFGHVNKLGQVARALEGRAKLTVAARDPAAVRALLPDLEITLLPAPMVATRPLHKGEQAGICYPGALRQDGWDRSDKLLPLLECWDALLAAYPPDVIVAQAAPASLLAARGTSAKTALLGSGYDAPPLCAPMPCYVPDDDKAAALAQDQEAKTLEVVNACLTARGQTPVAHFCDILRTDCPILVANPATDHFAPRARYQKDHPPYIGQILSVDTGTELAWRNRGVPKVLAYLRPNTPQFAAAAKGLGQLAPNLDLILAVPGIDPNLKSQLEARSAVVVDGPVRLDRLLPDCDLGVSHGTNGIGSAFIAFGVPQLGIPTHREQLLFSQAVARAGMGLGLAGKFGPEQVIEAVQKALAAGGLKTKTKAMAQTLKDDGLDRPAEQAADMLLATIGAAEP